jgi:prevent-host-death family protein
MLLVSAGQEDGMEKQWQLQEAKARFSEVVERALTGEAQVVTKRGKRAVVILAYEEYERFQAGDKSLWDIFKTAPRMDEDELPLERDRTPVRPVELE